MAEFQTHFRDTDLNRLSTATTGTAGYHSAANHIKKTAPPAIQHTANSITSNEQITADTVRTQVALALSALNVNPCNNNNTP